MNRNFFQLVLLLCSLAGWTGARGEGFQFGNYQVVSSNRVSRTEFEYVMRVTVTNQVGAAQGLTAEVFSWSADTTIVDGNVSFGNVGFAASATGTDTFTIRQNRLVPFNPANLQWFVSVQSMPLSVIVDAPESGFLTNGTTVRISGRVGPAVEGVRVGGVPANLTGTNFTALFTLEEGRNTISVLATNNYGGAGVANVIVNRDTTPPILSIDTPAAGSIVGSRQITVTGQINDVVPGTVNPEQATVKVNGLPATILNRSYAIAEVLLAPGKNKITAVGRDRAGNESRREIEITFQDPASQKRLVPLAGAAQTGIINSTLPDPVVVELVDGDGVVQTNQPVTFQITRSDGALIATPDSGRKLTVLTDDKGQAQVFFQLGSRSGVGNNEVTVSSAGVGVPVVFSASATSAPPANISALIPVTQVGEVSQPLALPWTAFVTDAGGNPVEGAPVTFTVMQGGGTLGGATTIVTNTDSDGRAKVFHTLGSEVGINNHVVNATVSGLSNAAAVFTASGELSGPANQTRISGVVLDNANRPMSNILCRVENTFLVTVTDMQGQFVISNAPVGAVRLNVDARDRGYGGNWHSLQFDLVTVAGQDNRVDRPIYMLPLDLAHSVVAGGSEDVTLTLDGVPGSSLTIFAHSVRDNNNQPVTNRVLWTQVNLERVPMAPPIGSQFTLAWTVQPINMRFNPPARVCLPNAGFPPGQVLEMFGFDHDINAFVSLGQGTVTPDGSQVCSNPGFGITKSGWGGFVPPPPPCTPVCGPAPADTDCIKYETIPPATKCDCPTYKPKQSKIVKVEAKVEGKDKTDACTNQTVNLTTTVTSENCSSLEYEWDFGDGTAKVKSANTSHSYTNTGAFTATVTVKCGKNCDTKTATVTVNVYRIEIQVNKTVATNDDLVQIKCDHPVIRHTNHCQVHIVGNADNDVTATLSNPDGRLLFPDVATKAVTLPKGGGFVPFDISGETQSAALGDARIQATASGMVCGEVGVTVFYFDNFKLTLTAKGGYATNDSGGSRTLRNTNSPSIAYAAAARLRPAGVDCGADQVKNLRVSIGQNIDFTDSQIYDTPSIAWAGGVTNGTTVTVPATITMTTATGGYINDTDAASDPLYDNGVIFPNIVQVPTGCTGSVDATGSDTPRSSAALTLNVPAKIGATTVGTATYKLNRLTSNNSFITWCVIYDLVTKEMCAEWEGTWAINMSSAGPNFGVPTAGASTAAASTTPKIGHPFANDVANDPTKATTTNTGSTTFTK